MMNDDNTKEEKTPTFFDILKWELSVIQQKISEHRNIVFWGLAIFILFIFVDANSTLRMTCKPFLQSGGDDPVPAAPAPVSNTTPSNNSKGSSNNKNGEQGNNNNNNNNMDNDTGDNKKKDKKDKKESKDDKLSLKEKRQRDIDKAFGPSGFFNKIKFHLMAGLTAIGILLLAVGVVLIPIILYAVVLFTTMKTNMSGIVKKL